MLCDAIEVPGVGRIGGAIEGRRRPGAVERDDRVVERRDDEHGTVVEREDVVRVGYVRIPLEPRDAAAIVDEDLRAFNRALARKAKEPAVCAAEPRAREIVDFRDRLAIV